MQRLARTNDPFLGGSRFPMSRRDLGTLTIMHGALTPNHAARWGSMCRHGAVAKVNLPATLSQGKTAKSTGISI
jgi:hypothetical protein